MIEFLHVFYGDHPSPMLYPPDPPEVGEPRPAPAISISQDQINTLVLSTFCMSQRFYDYYFFMSFVVTFDLQRPTPLTPLKGGNAARTGHFD